MLLDLLQKYKNGEATYEQLMVAVAQYDQLYDHAKFLCSMGIPIKSSKDFQRNQKKVIETLAYCVAGIDHSAGTDTPVYIPEGLYDKKEATEISKKVAVRYPWLNGDV